MCLGKAINWSTISVAWTQIERIFERLLKLFHRIKQLICCFYQFSLRLLFWSFCVNLTSQVFLTTRVTTYQFESKTKRFLKEYASFLLVGCKILMFISSLKGNRQNNFTKKSSHQMKFDPIISV